MRRDPSALTGATFDVLVVGGGVYGACAAWDAVSRGLETALVELADFGGATSANSQKLIHGGLRYLQKGQLRRVRESSRERRAFLRIAPRLVAPLDCVVPTYGHGLHGAEALRAALALNDALTRQRSRDRVASPTRRGRVLTREEVLRRFPTLPVEGLTGAGVWTDGLMRSSERLTLAFVLSAADAGAVAVNYVKAARPLVRSERGGRRRVVGVVARDELSGSDLEVRARVVLNAAGPWSGALAAAAGGRYPAGAFRLARGFNVVLDRALVDGVAMGVRGPTSDAVGSGGGALVRRLAPARRYFFLTPWRNRTIVGTRYLPHDGAPDDARATADEVEGLLASVNAAWPAAELRTAEVTAVQCGLLPLRAAGGAAEIADDHRLYDAALWDGPEGLVTLSGAKYTTARAAAEEAIDLVCARLRRGGPGRTATTPLLHATPWPVSREDDAEELPPHGTFALPPAQVVHAVRHEAAVRLGDLVFRRTDLAAAGLPAPGALDAAAAAMGAELGWDEERRRREVTDVEGTMARFSGA